MLIADNKEDLQAMLSLTHNYSAQSRYIIHPIKSQIVTYGDSTPPECVIGNDPIPATEE